MLEEIKKTKKVKDPVTENNKVIANHEAAAKHHEAAARYHLEAAKNCKNGDKDTACGCSIKAKGEGKLAKKLQKKNLKKYVTITR